MSSLVPGSMLKCGELGHNHLRTIGDSLLQFSVCEARVAAANLLAKFEPMKMEECIGQLATGRVKEGGRL